MSEKKIFFKRSNVSGKKPDASLMEYGEIAINYAADNEMLLLKNSKNEVAAIKSKPEISDVKNLNTELSKFVHSVSIINGESGNTEIIDGELIIWAPNGVQGSTGVVGAQGTQGLEGAQGNRGNQGPQGATGAQGPQGAQGAAGVQGHRGSVGTASTVQGAQGAVGAQGPQGVQGSIGATGNRGNQGAIGVKGAQGATGAQGPQGVQGAAGVQGHRGSIGTASTVQGAQGAAGAQGPQGVQGSIGAAGNRGNQGAVGITGAQGAVGAQGAQGAQGNGGANGIQGARGNQGMPGIQGAPGNQGYVGSQGVYGSAGALTTLVASSGENRIGILIKEDDGWTGTVYRNTGITVGDSTIILDTVSANTIYANKAYAAEGYYQLSDERLKTFDGDLKDTLDKVNMIPKKYYYWKNNSDKRQIGTSAQEIQKLYPELVTENDKGELTVAYDKLSIVALSAIDELIRENTLIKEEINILKKKLSL